MAPAQSDHDVVEGQLKDIIQDLYNILVQVNTYDTAGKPTNTVLQKEIKRLTSDLHQIHTTTTSSASSSSPTPAKLPSVPPELIQYVDSGRNPDIYTREFVELARKGNQLMKGKMEAFAGFRDVLAEEMGRCLPECRADVEGVVKGTGG
ncbi:mediator complex, subunit Med10, partial [Tricladium varicosporioides]